MCGIAGILTKDVAGAGLLRDIAARMAEQISHRGPDAGGIWQADGDAALLVHRRLAILDLTPQGAQPMVSHCGRYVISYNGELFNHAVLRAAVEQHRAGVNWRGHSDTEVLLEAIAAFGMDDALRRFHGMFAFALWDRERRQLHLVRDRLGKKPLYYGLLGNDLVFASELKAMAAHPQWRFEPDHEALRSYLRHGYVVCPLTGVRGVLKLLPGTFLTVSAEDLSRRQLAAPRRYWNPAELLQRPAFSGDPESAVAQVLRTAVADRMVADVTVGAFLSGGVDSSLVVALMAQLGGAGLQTYTIGIGDSGHSEAPFAAAVAAHLGTRHTELCLSAAEAAALVPEVVATYDEPLADSSAVPTWLVSRLAAADVKVVLSGDGADELFAGYSRYQQNQGLWRVRRFLPAPARWLLRSLAGRRLDAPEAGRIAAVLASLAARNATDFYRCRVSHVRDPARLLPGGEEFLASGRGSGGARLSIVREMMYADLLTYLTDDILAKVDRASMAHGLEVRSPFLDERLVDLAWSMQAAEAIDQSGGKRVLKSLLHTLVPQQLIDRPKTGFGLPVEDWLRGSLRSWVEGHLFDTGRISAAGFDMARVAAVWRQFRSGNVRLGGLVWHLVVLGVWLDSQRASAEAGHA